jgi:hypothetical protein
MVHRESRIETLDGLLGKDVLMLTNARASMEPQGQQILTVFKTDRLIPFEGNYLESARQVVARHDKLQSQLWKRQRPADAQTANRTMGN